MELLTLIPVIGLTLGWQHWQRTTASAAMLHTVSAMVLLLFVASLIGLLMPATVLLVVSGTVVAAIEGRRHIREQITLPVPIGIFAILGVAYWFVHSGSALFFYDEYSHWGVYLKEMLAHDELWGANTNAMHPRYLPGAPLWQYFFAVFSGRPEGAAYLAQFALLITPLLVLWENTQWRHMLWHVVILLLIIVAVSNFGNGFTSLYVDHLLSTWFVGVPLNYLLEMNSRSPRQRLSYLLPLALIVLIKTTGMFFALSVAGIIGLLLFFDSGNDTGNERRSAICARAIMFPALTVILCLSILSVWNLNRDSMQVGAGGVSASEIIGNLAAGESIFDEAQQAELTRRFIDVVLHQQISKDEVSAEFNAFSYPTMEYYKDNYRLTTASLLGISLVALILLWRTIVPHEIRMQWTIVAGCVWLTALAYICALYFGYRLVSATENGLILSSYIRYAHTMLLPLVLFGFATLLPALAGRQTPIVRINEKVKVSRRSLVFSVVLVTLMIFEPPYLRPLFIQQQPPEFRWETEPLTTQLREGIGEASLWVLFPSKFSDGLFGQILKYELTPGRTHVELDAAEIFERYAMLREDLRHWQYAWFPAAGPELDRAIERLIGAPITERLYRIDTSGADIQFIPVSGILPGSGLSD